MNQEILEQEQAEYLLKTDSISEQVSDIANAVEAGWLNPLESYIVLKRLSDTVAASMSKVKDQAIAEAEKYETKEFQFKGAKVAVRNSAGRWDYSNVAQYTDLKERLKSVESLAKSAAAEAKHGNKVYDSDGVEISPAVYTEGATTIAISLLKDA